MITSQYRSNVYNPTVKQGFDGDYETTQTVHPRIAYLRKVYLMIFIQLAIVWFIGYQAAMWVNVRTWFLNNYWVYILALILVLGSFLVGLLARKSISKSPIDWIVYSAFTLGAGLVVASWVSQY